MGFFGAPARRLPAGVDACGRLVWGAPPAPAHPARAVAMSTATRLPAHEKRGGAVVERRLMGGRPFVRRGIDVRVTHEASANVRSWLRRATPLVPAAVSRVADPLDVNGRIGMERAR